MLRPAEQSCVPLGNLQIPLEISANLHRFMALLRLYLTTFTFV